MASQPSRGILKSPPLSVSQDQNGYKRFSFSGLKTSADLTPVEGINISKFGTFQDDNQIESSIGDKSLKSAGVKAASVSFCSDVQNALEGHNFPVSVLFINNHSFIICHHPPNPLKPSKTIKGVGFIPSVSETSQLYYWKWGQRSDDQWQRRKH